MDKNYAYFIAYNVWRNYRQELYFSWSMTIPFYIMPLNIWSPGNVLNENEDGGDIFNCMYDLTQFIVSCILIETRSEALSIFLMKQVILTFGMITAVVVNTDSRFRSTFEAMCKLLKLIFWSLSRRNHKGNSVESYHKFLDKTQTISGQDRETHEVFHQNIKPSQYAWNSVTIDDTYIPRCVATIGREFRFPLDIELLNQPSLNNKEHSALFHYLLNISCNSQFSISVLQTLIEERSSTHRER